MGHPMGKNVSYKEMGKRLNVDNTVWAVLIFWAFNKNRR